MLGLPTRRYGNPDSVNFLLPIRRAAAFQGKDDGLVFEDPMAALLFRKAALTISFVKVRNG